MASVGQRLRLLRESRDTSIEEMVVATGIGQSYLEALERDEIQVLPGKAFGKLYIRAYAEVFGFDPQPWIDDYDREQRFSLGASTEPAHPVPSEARPVAAAIARWKASRATAERDEPVVDEVVADAPNPKAPSVEPVVDSEVLSHTAASVQAAKGPIAPIVLLGAVVVAAAIYFGVRGTGGDENANPTTEARPAVRPVPEWRPPEPPPPAVAKPQPAPSTKTPVVREMSVGALIVSEFGVGRRVVNSRLEGLGSEFTPGEVACFQTRVVGGRNGETIRHVWIYDGRAQQAITLRLGGPDWRTYTNKTLYKPGPWSVEARDGNGRVLATASFVCVPAGR